MHGTPFARILEQIVRALPGARGAILIDWEGEEVDSFAHGDATEIRLVGAHWGIIHNQVRTALAKLQLGPPVQIMLRFQRQQVVIQRVTEDYLAVLTMGPEANLGRAFALMRRARPRLQQEM